VRRNIAVPVLGTQHSAGVGDKESEEEAATQTSESEG